jgi:hypothetical protein
METPTSDDFNDRTKCAVASLDGPHFVGVRRTRGIHEGLFVEAGGFDHQRVALEVIAVEPR